MKPLGGRLMIGLLALAACSRPAPTTAADPAPPPAPVAPAPARAVEARKPMWIELGKPVPVGDDVGTTITLTNYIVEAIAASPGGSYPAGSGTTLHITIAGEPLQLTELSAGYESQRVAWTIAGQNRPVMETGLTNLTKDTSPALIHFADGQSQQWLMVRLPETETAPKP